MAAEVVSLYGKLQLDINPYAAALTKAGVATGRFERVAVAGLNKVSAQSKLTATEMARLNTVSFARLSSSIGGLGASIKSFAAVAGLGLGINGLQNIGDAAIRTANNLRNAGLEGDSLNQAYKALFVTAQKTAVPVESLSQLFGQAALSQKELGVSTADLLRFTDRTALALQVAGTSAQSASGSLLQLSQILGSSVTRSQEFNSILSGIPTMAQAAARGIAEAGGSVGKLRELVNEGKVSSRAFFEGFLAGSVELETKAAGAASTVEQGYTRLRNALQHTANEFNNVLKVTDQAANGLSSLADVLKRAGDNAELARRPFNELSLAIKGTGSEAEGLYGWLEKIAKLNIPFNVGKYVAGKLKVDDWTSPALPLSFDELGGDTTMPVPLPRARPAATASTISLAQFPASQKSTDSLTQETDAFTRSAQAIERRTALLRADLATVGLSETARERARVVAELETAAIRLNAAEGKKNTEVTEEQRAKIEQLANAYSNVRGKIEAANGPLQQWMRNSADIKTNLEGIATSGLEKISDELADVVSGTKSASEAFESMTTIILKELQKMLLKMAIAAAIKAMLGGDVGFGFGGGLGAGGMGFTGKLGGLYAKGAAFQNGKPITAFARGGIVSAPTLFPFAKGTGLMGEAGPEAIMPLSRGPGGKLGVQALGAGGGDINVFVNNNHSSAQVRTEQRQNPNGGMPDIVITIDELVARNIASRQGRTFEAMKNTFGLDPTRGMV